MSTYFNGTRVNRYKRLYKISSIAGVLGILVISTMMYHTYLLNQTKTEIEIIQTIPLFFIGIGLVIAIIIRFLKLKSVMSYLEESIELDDTTYKKIETFMDKDLKEDSGLLIIKNKENYPILIFGIEHEKYKPDIWDYLFFDPIIMIWD